MKEAPSSRGSYVFHGSSAIHCFLLAAVLWLAPVGLHPCQSALADDGGAPALADDALTPAVATDPEAARADYDRPAGGQGPIAGWCGESGLCCFGDSGFPGCNDAECCEAVCLVDPFCCIGLWDQFCISKALAICPGCVPPCGDGPCQPGQNCETCPEDCGDCASMRFTPGHVFVSHADHNCCEFSGGFDRIWEVDPETGEVSLFATMGGVHGEWCGCMSGLVFSRDGSRLRSSAILSGHVLEYDPSGHFIIALASEEGIGCPAGSNNMAYDVAGDFYVVDHCFQNIKRYPADDGPPTVVADFADGVIWSGALAFTTGGDLYYAAHETNVLRISASGDVSVFLEEAPSFSPNSLAADNCGNLYVQMNTSHGPEVRKYIAGDPESEQLLAELPSGTAPIATTPDEKAIYVAQFDTLYALDIATGNLSIVAEGGFVPFGPVGGVAVAPYPRGDVDLDDDIDSDDFALWIGCPTGPGAGIDCASTFGCQIADLDRDGDLDLRDVASLMVASRVGIEP